MKFFTCLLLVISLNSFAAEDHHDHNHDHHEEKEKKSLDAHEHGVSTLNLVQDMNKISFEFEMPGFDVVGFEYKAKKKNDIKKVKKALNLLSEAKNMLIINSEAECKKEESSARVVNEGSHSEFISEYILSCNKISLIKKIKIIYFDTFPLSKKLKINLVANNQKLSQVFDINNNTINVEGYF